MSLALFWIGEGNRFQAPSWISGMLIGQDAGDKRGTNSQLQFCAGGLGAVAGGERLMGFRTSGAAWLEVSFCCFLILALRFSALHFVGKAGFFGVKVSKA